METFPHKVISPRKRTEIFVSASLNTSTDASVAGSVSTGIHNTARAVDVPSLGELK